MQGRYQAILVEKESYLGAVSLHRSESHSGSSYGSDYLSVAMEQLWRNSGYQPTTTVALYGLDFESVWERTEAGSGGLSELRGGRTTGGFALEGSARTDVSRVGEFPAANRSPD